jgi:ribosomal protein L30/L7E
MIPAVPPRPAPPFTPASIGEEIERGRIRAKWSVIRTTKFLGVERTYWYVLKRGDGPFRWEWVAELALAWGAPRGWPIIPWEEAETLQALRQFGTSRNH